MWPTIPIQIGSGEVVIHLYSIMAGLGFCHLFVGVDTTARSKKMDPNVIGNYLYALGFAVVGAYAFSLLVTQLFYGSDHPFGSVAVMPAILGGLFTLIIAAKGYRLSLKTWLPLSMPFFCFAHAWGRLGCFLGGCCHGKPTDSFLGVRFPAESLAYKAHGLVPVHPTQLYEMGFLILLGLALQFLVPMRHRIYSYLLLYGAGRLIIEFFRGDNRGSMEIIPDLSPSQQLCLLFITAGAVLAWRSQSVPSEKDA